MAAQFTPTFKTFAIAGVGRFGSHLVEALVAAHPSTQVHVLTRGDKHKGDSRWESHSQITIHPHVDYTVDNLSQLLKRISAEVVITTFGAPSIKGQAVVVEAAKEAGCVKVFVPSEFGTPSDGISLGNDDEQGMSAEKMKIAKKVQDAGLPCLRIYNGFFIADIPWVTAYTENDLINVVGDADRPVSYTAIQDAAGFAAYVLTHLPPDQMNTVYRIEGDRKTPTDIASIMDTTLNHVESIPGQLSELRTVLGKLMSAGLGDVFTEPKPDSVLKRGDRSREEEMAKANGLWEGHAFLAVKDVLLPAA